MKVLASAVLALLSIAAVSSGVLDDVADTGYHVAARVSATNECVSGAVQDARDDGANLSIVVLAVEPDGGATVYARELLDQLAVPGTVFVVAPETVDYADNEGFWSAGELEDALGQSTAVASDNDVVRTFVNTLTGADELCSSSSIAGKSGWGAAVMMVIIVGGVVYLTVRTVRRRSDAEISS